MRVKPNVFSANFFERQERDQGNPLHPYRRLDAIVGVISLLALLTRFVDVY
jgi:hypothetical protein